MASVASQLIEEITAHAQSDSLEDARGICADGTYFPNNLRRRLSVYSQCLNRHSKSEPRNAHTVRCHRTDLPTLQSTFKVM